MFNTLKNKNNKIMRNINSNDPYNERAFGMDVFGFSDNNKSLHSKIDFKWSLVYFI